MTEIIKIENETILKAKNFIQLLKSTKNLDDISRSYQNILYQYAVKATVENPITYLIPTCPHYSEKHGRTDYISMESGIPSMAKQVVDGTEEFINTLILSEIPFKLKVLIADQEVGDENILRTMNLSPLSFLSNIMSSKHALEEYLSQVFTIPFEVSTFMSEFYGLNDISIIEKLFIDRIKSNLILNDDTSEKLRRIIDYTIGIESERLKMLHQRLLENDQKISFEECAENKVIYNLGQYLAIGEVAIRKYKFPIIGVTDSRLQINHRNKPEFKLENSLNKTESTVPLITFKK